MNLILDKIGATRLSLARFFGFWAILFTLVLALTSCSDDLDVQQSYPFSVEVMPYADKIAKGQTVELRFEIKPEGNYTNTLYTIRYFQYDGEGTLKLVDGPVLVNNDRSARKQDLPPQLHRKIKPAASLFSGGRGQFQFYPVGTDI